MIRAVIFDCFGVIITDALALVCADLQTKNPAAAERISDIIRANNRGLIEPAESNKMIADILGLSVEAFREKVASGEVKDHRVLDLAAALRANRKTAMLTNASGQSLPRRFSEEELQKAFDVVVASGDIGFAKPEPQAFEIVADRLGVRLNECVMIDDREEYCEGARGVGMQAILYTDFDQAKAELDMLLADSKH